MIWKCISVWVLPNKFNATCCASMCVFFLFPHTPKQIGCKFPSEMRWCGLTDSLIWHTIIVETLTLIRFDQLTNGQSWDNYGTTLFDWISIFIQFNWEKCTGTFFFLHYSDVLKIVKKNWTGEITLIIFYVLLCKLLSGKKWNINNSGVYQGLYLLFVSDALAENAKGPFQNLSVDEDYN